jgi:glucose/arabinose dehydrogenase
MNYFRSIAAAFIIFHVFASINCRDTTEKSTTSNLPRLRDSVIISGLDHPWEILWGPDNFIWMTERDGRVSRIDPVKKTVHPLITIKEVVSRGEGGLLGMALHPKFSLTPYVYLIYNYNKGAGYAEKLVRYLYDGKTLVQPVTLLDNIEASSIHNGSRLLIIGDKLFITTGDASRQSTPQSPLSLNGKILRINLDGSIPADNPSPGNPYWTLGHRNAQGLVYANQKLYISEHGPNNDDEINIIEKGRNYGWPNVEGFCKGSKEESFCNQHNVKEPLFAWTPTTAVAGLDFYDHDLIPEWKNSLLLVTLKDATLVQLKLDKAGTKIAGTSEFFKREYGRLRDICVSPTGKVYISSSNGGNDDKIIQITSR